MSPRERGSGVLKEGDRGLEFPRTGKDKLFLFLFICISDFSHDGANAFSSCLTDDHVNVQQSWLGTVLGII